MFVQRKMWSSPQVSLHWSKHSQSQKQFQWTVIIGSEVGCLFSSPINFFNFFPTRNGYGIKNSNQYIVLNAVLRGLNWSEQLNKKNILNYTSKTSTHTLKHTYLWMNDKTLLHAGIGAVCSGGHWNSLSEWIKNKMI